MSWTMENTAFHCKSSVTPLEKRISGSRKRYGEVFKDSFSTSCLAAILIFSTGSTGISVSGHIPQSALLPCWTSQIQQKTMNFPVTGRQSLLTVDNCSVFYCRVVRDHIDLLTHLPRSVQPQSQWCSCIEVYIFVSRTSVNRIHRPSMYGAVVLRAYTILRWFRFTK